MTPTSLLRSVLVGWGIVALFALAGCRKWPSFFDQSPTPTPTSTPAPATHSAEETAAITAVSAYITALEKHDYATAYDLLSADSQSKHSRASFEQQAKKGEMPSYDLKSAHVLSMKGNDALVEVRMTEDPATHGFTMHREGGSWKVVYWGGTPDWPEAEE
jgi:hypothetical protein